MGDGASGARTTTRSVVLMGLASMDPSWLQTSIVPSKSTFTLCEPCWRIKERDEKKLRKKNPRKEKDDFARRAATTHTSSRTICQEATVSWSLRSVSQDSPSARPWSTGSLVFDSGRRGKAREPDGEKRVEPRQPSAEVCSRVPDPRRETVRVGSV